MKYPIGTTGFIMNIGRYLVDPRFVMKPLIIKENSDSLDFEQCIITLIDNEDHDYIQRCHISEFIPIDTNNSLVKLVLL